MAEKVTPDVTSKSALNEHPVRKPSGSASTRKTGNLGTRGTGIRFLFLTPVAQGLEKRETLELGALGSGFCF